MAKITFISFYNDFSVGVNVLSRVLIEAGHKVSTIFFKLPCQKEIEWFKEEPGCMETFSPYGDIVGSNSDVNKASTRDIKILLDLILELKTDILCISSRSPDRDIALLVLPQIREIFKGIILAGGYGPTFDPETYSDLVDYVYRGEAENKIVELISLIECGKSIEDFDNISYKKNGELVVNKFGEPEEMPLREQLINKDSFYIDYDKLYTYENRHELIRYPYSYSIFFGRGCINTCSYCSAGNWRNLYKKEGFRIPYRRNRQIESVINELIKAKNSGIIFVNFRDEYLTAKFEVLKQFFHMYENEVNIPFWAYLVPKHVVNDPEILRIAVDAGFIDTVVGFQSGSDYINRTFFTRPLPNKYHVEYAHLLAKYKINVKYDLITFNPAETDEHVKETFKLIQALPKERAYLSCARLFFLPGTPASKLCAKFKNTPGDFERYYRNTLLYLICFVMSENEFGKILNNQKMISSWQNLLAFYKDYLEKRGIAFPIGTHDVPGSITTHRYQRMLKKYNYPEIIVWGNGEYYKEMVHIFKGESIRYHIDDEVNGNGIETDISPPEVLSGIKEQIPVFICSSRKQEINTKIMNEYSNFPGKIIV